MPTLDPTHERELAAYAREVGEALGESCISVILYGSGAGVDWVKGRSDVNTAVVLERASVAALDALAAIVARWRSKGFALPVILDREQVEHARVLFPMELDDIVRQHRVLIGADPFAGVSVDDAALRRECAQEAFGKLLRVRAFYLAHAGDPTALGRMMTESLKSFLIVIRHLLRLRGAAVPHAYDAALAAGEGVVGALPAMRQVLAHRVDAPAVDPTRLRALARDYVAEVERVVAAVGASGA